MQLNYDNNRNSTDISSRRSDPLIATDWVRIIKILRGMHESLGSYCVAKTASTKTPAPMPMAGTAPV